jgi:ABC-2 type transport system ATP-binding protein
MYDGDLAELLEKFAPCRQVRVELAQGVSKTALEKYGEIESIDGQEVRFFVQREQLTSAIARILSELEVLDLSVTDPPIEEVIGRLFQQGTVN